MINSLNKPWLFCRGTTANYYVRPFVQQIAERLLSLCFQKKSMPHSYICIIIYIYIYKMSYYFADSLSYNVNLMLNVSNLLASFRYKEKEIDVQRWEFIKENKKVRKQENKNPTKKVILVAFLVEFLFSCFLDRFLGRVLVFLFSYFLVFFYKFPPQFYQILPSSSISKSLLEPYNFFIS